MKERELDVATAPLRNSRHWKQERLRWGEVLEWAKTPGSKKTSGNYVMGRLRETTVDHEDRSGCTALHRTKVAIESRSAFTLDADHLEPDDIDDLLLLLLPYEGLMHTTFSSTPDSPRVRIILPASRDMTPDEYTRAAMVLMRELGMKRFDPGSSQPERYMFKPATPDPASYEQWHLVGDLIDVDDVLSRWDPLEDQDTPKPNRTKRDPFAIEGVVGAFNRVYSDFDELIRTYELPYEKAGSKRWQLVGADSAAGMGVVAEGLVFSHHANDPAGGQTCSAFDLVRLHRFGHLDADPKYEKTPVNRRPSHDAMIDLANQDTKVLLELYGDDFAEDIDSVAWKANIRRSKTGRVLDVVANWDLFRANDPVFGLLRYNEMTLAPEFSGDPPWRKIYDDPELTIRDRTEFVFYIEREYGLKTTLSYLDNIIATVAMSRPFNPVREYLDSLEWDGVPRVETALPGVEPSPYTRIVARKVFAAAVARIYEPGIKWDHVLVLFGPEGIGKSYWIDKMARGYSSSLGRVNDKDTLLKLQKSWIVTSDEGHALRRESEEMKEFLTRRSDMLRVPYAKEVRSFKRHCVFWSTTNDEVFLRRQEGNRRFLIVRSENPVDFDALTPEYIDQVWAEAVEIYRDGEQLFLNDNEAALAVEEREPFTEEDSLTGIIQEYLDTLVPDNWWELSPSERSMWIRNARDGLVSGTEPIDRVCSLQVWVEALDRPVGDYRRSDLTEITKVLKKLPGWRVKKGRHRLPGYGTQMVFERAEEE